MIADGIRLVTTTTGTSSGVYYVHNDHLGTPQTLTDNNQDIVWAAEYDPFGKATVTTETITNNVRFPGQYFDQETGLHYNYFRTYDPATGRYITSDPIGLVGGINTYAYVEGNPLSFIDSFGLAVGMKKNRNAKDLMHGTADFMDSAVCDWWPAACLFQCVRWECTIKGECGKTRTFYIGQGYPYYSTQGYDPNKDENCVCVKTCAKGEGNCLGNE